MPYITVLNINSKGLAVFLQASVTAVEEYAFRLTGFNAVYIWY